MERVEEWEREQEEAAADLIQRTRRGKLGHSVGAGVEAAVETDRSVYFYEDEGMWKCRHCLWTFRMGSPGMHHVHNHKEHFRGLVNAKTWQGSYFCLQSEGTESNNEIVGMEVENDVLTADEENQVGKGADFKKKNERVTNDSSNVDVSSSTDVELESQLSSSITFTETNFSTGIESTIENMRMKMDGPNAGREHTKNDETYFAIKNVEKIDGLLNLDDDKGPMNLKVQSHLSSKFRYSSGHGENGTMKFNADKDAVEVHKYGRLAHGGKPEVVEIDVERVLEEQDTHDLFCPNCHSCITKRVILRKRKRMVQDIQYDTKRGKPVFGCNLNPNLNVPAATNVTNQDREPEVFRCLSCFSLFIQTASGFKISGFFRKGNEGQNLQSTQQITAKNLSWISSILNSFMVRKTRNGPVPDDTNNSNSLKPGGMIPEDEYNVPIPPRPGVPDDFGIPIPPVPDDFGTPIRPRPGVPDDFGIPIPPIPPVPDDFGIPIPPRPGVPDDSGIPIPPRPELPEDFGIKSLEDPDLKPLEDENKIPIPIPLKPEVPEDFGFGGEEEVEDPDLKPLEDEDNLRNPPKPEVPEDFDISSDKQVEDPKPLEDENNFPIPPKPEVPGVSGEKHVEDPDLKPLEDENDIPIPPKPEPAPLLEAEPDITQKPGDKPEKNSEEDGTLPPVEEKTDEELMNPPPPEDQVMQNDQDTLASPKSVTPGVPTEDPLSKPEQEVTLAPDEVQVDIPEPKPAAEETQPEDDTIQPAEGGSSTPAGQLSSQSNQNAPSSTEPVVSTDLDTKIDVGQEEVDKTTTNNWDILKSIVYGGLVESLTSLGVVSSAAASNASTLNIVALGLANLIGGLFVLAHNLKELKNEQYSASSDDSEETVDRYKETLGQREHFKRHVFFAVLSYIIFGLIPPVVYGFSFMKSDNEDYKLLVVAAASIVCITVLAIGKAYVQKSPKKYVKTVLYFLVMGVLASGISYVAGQLLHLLLEKIGLFKSSTATLTSTFLEMRPVESGLASF